MFYRETFYHFTIYYFTNHYNQKPSIKCQSMLKMENFETKFETAIKCVQKPFEIILFYFLYFFIIRNTAQLHLKYCTDENIEQFHKNVELNIFNLKDKLTSRINISR